MSAYFISTLTWTCLLAVNAQGIVTYTAPRHARWAQGQAWTRIVDRLRRAHGGTLHIIHVPSPEDEEAA